MRALLGLAICCAACSFDPGVPGDDDGSGSGSGAGSGSNAGPDTDGDGHADPADNCPEVGNPDQRNHDSDDRGDACDVCPHVIDLGKDTDADGVGDGCDPRPTTPGDRIAYFEGFYDDPASWSSVVGPDTWQLGMDGTIRQPSTTAAYQLVHDDTPNLGAVFVDARVKIHAVSTNNTIRRSTGVVLAYRDPNHYVFCGLAASLSADAEVQAGQVTTDLFGAPYYDYLPGDFPAQMAGDWLIVQATTAPADWGN